MDTAYGYGGPVTQAANFTSSYSATGTVDSSSTGNASFEFGQDDGNSSSVSYPDMGRYDIYVPVVYGVVFVPGVIGNCLAIFLICRYDKLKSVPSVFILNLALADMLFMLGIPFLAYALASPSWELGTAMCKVVLAIDGLNQFTGVLFLTFMSFDRCMVVVYPMEMRTLRNPKRAKIISAIVWVVSELIILPMWLYSRVVRRPDGNYACNIIFPGNFGRKHFLVYTFVVGFALPVTIILICYALITWNLLRNRCPAAEEKRRRSSVKVIKMVALYVVIFVVCWLPFYVIQFVYVFHMDPAVPPSRAFFALYLTSICLSYANSAINPYVYTLSAGKHRRDLKAVWKKLPFRSQATTQKSGAKSSKMNGFMNKSKPKVRRGILSRLSGETAGSTRKGKCDFNGSEQEASFV